MLSVTLSPSLGYRAIPVPTYAGVTNLRAPRSMVHMHPYVCREKLLRARQTMHVSPRRIPRGAHVLFAGPVERDMEAVRRCGIDASWLDVDLRRCLLSPSSWTEQGETLCNPMEGGKDSEGE